MELLVESFGNSPDVPAEEILDEVPCENHAECLEHKSVSLIFILWMWSYQGSGHKGEPEEDDGNDATDDENVYKECHHASFQLQRRGSIVIFQPFEPQVCYPERNEEDCEYN